jgi:hypothetical protein
MKGYWHAYSPEDLRKLIKEEPLTPQRIDHLLKYHSFDVIFSDKTKPAILLDNRGGFDYIIFIYSPDNMEKQKKDLVHRVVHAWYKVSIFNVKDGKCPSGEIERMIIKESERFYKQNQKYVDSLYRKLKSKN